MASNPAWFVLEIVNVEKVKAPVLVVRLTAVLPELVTLVVLLKLKAALDVFTLMPMPVDVAIVVEPLDIAPATLVKLMPVAELPVDEMLVKAAVEETGPLSVPVVRLSACPVPLMVVSASVSVPKPVPVIPIAAPAVPLRVTPRMVLPLPKVMFATLAEMVGFVPPVVGRPGESTVPEGADCPMRFRKVSPAPWPISFCPESSVTPPV